MIGGYQSSAPGPYKAAVIGEDYRAVKLMNSAVGNVTVVVTSGNNVGVSLTLTPGEIHPGTTRITSGTVTEILGYTI